MANKHNNVLYVGVTNNIERRVFEHKTSFNPGSFTSKFNCNKLVYFEKHTDINKAIKREKNIKDWKREWKDKLINEENSLWEDLAKDWTKYG